MLQPETIGALDRAGSFPHPLRVRDVARQRVPNRLTRSSALLRIDDLVTR